MNTANTETLKFCTDNIKTNVLRNRRYGLNKSIMRELRINAYQTYYPLVNEFDAGSFVDTQQHLMDSKLKPACKLNALRAKALEDARRGALLARIDNVDITSENIRQVNAFPPLYRCDVSADDTMADTRWFKDVTFAVVTVPEMRRWIESTLRVGADFVMDNPQNRAHYLSYNNLESIKNHSGLDFYIYEVDPTLNH